MGASEKKRNMAVLLIGFASYNRLCPSMLHKEKNVVLRIAALLLLLPFRLVREKNEQSRGRRFSLPTLYSGVVESFLGSVFFSVSGS